MEQEKKRRERDSEIPFAALFGLSSRPKRAGKWPWGKKASPNGQAGVE